MLELISIYTRTLSEKNNITKKGGFMIDAVNVVCFHVFAT
jgi:hypothetical protein